MAAFILGVTCTLGARVFAAGKTGEGLFARLRLFTRVLTYIEDNYVDRVDETKLIQGAIHGMMETLDPHSEFLTPGDYQSLKEDTSGDFGGIGLEFAERNDALVVVTPLDGTPAARAGLRPGDIIAAIDGASTHGLSADDAIDRLRGPAGSAVTLSLTRPDAAEPFVVKLTRERIQVVSVDGRLLDGSIGYIRIHGFQDHTDIELRQVLRNLRAKSGHRLQGIVLDLRNNPGGLLEQGELVADAFLTHGNIVLTRGRDGHLTDEARAGNDGTEPDCPIVVLVNRGTASAAEIVAGALQDNRRAVVFGTSSFGKGSVQSIFELDGGSALKLTTARYYTPSGRSIQERGITPDVAVSGADEPTGNERNESTLPGHFLNDTPAETIPAVPVNAVLPGLDIAGDRPLQAAERALHGWVNFSRSLAAVADHPVTQARR